MNGDPLYLDGVDLGGTAGHEGRDREQLESH